MSAPENPNAFPSYSPDESPFNHGMTLRDWFAGQVANGMAAHSGTMGTPFGPGDIAKRSYEIADAMLLARTNPIQGEGK